MLRDTSRRRACHKFDGINLVDQLEKKGISWETLQESVPDRRLPWAQFPPTGPALYAQKHNPFVYFTDIATNPARLQKIKPFDLSALKVELSQSGYGFAFHLYHPEPVQ